MGMCSLHRHNVKDETFTVLAGVVHLQVGDDVHVLKNGDSFRITPGTWHRFSNKENSHPKSPNAVPATILETSTHHDDLDVERAFPSMYLGPKDGE